MHRRSTALAAAVMALTPALAIPATAAAPVGATVVAAEFGADGTITERREHLPRNGLRGMTKADPRPAKADPRPAKADPRPAKAPAAAGVRSRTVGLLESTVPGGTGLCTASMVASTHQVLVITAAHCVHEGGGGRWLNPIHFTPDYVDGQAPLYGRFRAKAAYTFEGWTKSGLYHWDLAFVLLEPNDIGVPGELVGENGIIVNAPRVATRTIISYENLVLHQCTGETSRSPLPLVDFRVWMWGCPTTPTEGDSGSPWLEGYDPQSQLGYVNGVISQGSAANGNVITPYFDDYIGDLYLDVRELS
ncbi:trypsin-like serine peptidase [Actinosynnema sp. CS-041913]|uniref:trypsin-like serine peptidase n=1 Tax=Actinosynnema sp. CS-041913 TaxID=3239917 RepID=UPI003D8EB781